MGKAGRNDTSGLTAPAYAVWNLARAVPIATRVLLAGSSADRRRGLLGVESLADGAGLWIAPCEAIHTFGMRMSIDVLFLDGELKISKLIVNLRPARIAVCMSAHSVLELQAGAIARTGSQVRDRLKFELIPAA